MQHFPVRHSTLDENALAEWLLSRYSLRESIRCRFFRRSMSDVYWVDTRDSPYILKVYMHSRHSKQDIEAEISFLGELLEHDVPVAAPVENNDAAYLNQINAPEGTRYAVLFNAITGREPQEENLEHSRSFGRWAGHMHNCADSLGRRFERRHLDEQYLIKEPLHYVGTHLQNRKRDLEYLSAFGSDLMAELHSLVSKETPEYGLCHGDLHTGNARFDKNGQLRLFDFDSFGRGWRAIDIGVYHVSYDWLDLTAETKRRKDRFWQAFLDGYDAERPLSSNELAVAQLCLPIRHLELMGIALRYWSPQIGSSWINADYFDRHLSWFKKWANEYRGM